MNDNRITIVSVTDNFFVVHLAALLKSIEINNKSGEKIDYYVVADKVSELNKRKLYDSIKSDSITIHWKLIDEVIPPNVQLPQDKSEFPSNIYVRLFIPYFVPAEVDRVLYLDVDMIAMTDVSELWNVDIGHHILAGVVDRLETVSNSWAGIKNYKELGLNPESKYFNSGLLVIKPKEWRARRMPEKILACIQQNKAFAEFPDQYGLNVIFADQWFELDKRWNCYSFLSEPSPFIVHFMAKKPIYKSYNFNRDYQQAFFNYLALTEWNGFRPIGDTTRLFKKYLNMAAKGIRSIKFVN